MDGTFGFRIREKDVAIGLRASPHPLFKLSVCGMEASIKSHSFGRPTRASVLSAICSTERVSQLEGEIGVGSSIRLLTFLGTLGILIEDGVRQMFQVRKLLELEQAVVRDKRTALGQRG